MIAARRAAVGPPPSSPVQPCLGYADSTPSSARPRSSAPGYGPAHPSAPVVGPPTFALLPHGIHLRP